MTTADATPSPSREGGSVLPGWAGAHRPGRRRIRASTLAMGAWMLLAATIVVVALGFQLSGGRWFIIETPSMGTVAPVGTFVLTEPATMGELAVGDIISFHPPTAPGEVYTHRVVALDAAGATT